MQLFPSHDRVPSNATRLQGDRMRDEDYCDVMLEAYRDVMLHITTESGTDLNALLKYLKESIAYHVKWRRGE